MSNANPLWQVLPYVESSELAHALNALEQCGYDVHGLYQLVHGSSFLVVAKLRPQDGPAKPADVAHTCNV